MPRTSHLRCAGLVATRGWVCILLAVAMGWAGKMSAHGAETNVAVTAPAAAHATALDAGPETNAVPLRGPELWFPVGEQLEYTIYWGVIPVGRTVITTEWVAYEGRTLLLITYRTKSNKVIATVYPVDDTIESLIDPLTFRPVIFTKNLREGRHRYHETTTFDYDALKARKQRRSQD